MKFSIILASLLSIAAASPTASPEINFSVDVVAIREAIASSTLGNANFVALLDRNDIAALDISKRATCPPSQFCNAGRCKRIECFPAGTTTTCVTTAYGQC
ncbi:hypothetical protein V495_00450 [Pseudogymnoascus sp. VKM F-4514 (FW-929)]|nr:hypothetical protein V495_00450 [Pseudogymnoascus sp. VKM F-4514 (FW-929)]KFY62915.1 hypothetical protein V497_02173 [Pseudogymnoascus sp. VKM F-4516 (FW-969)]